MIGRKGVISSTPDTEQMPPAILPPEKQQSASQVNMKSLDHFPTTADWCCPLKAEHAKWPVVCILLSCILYSVPRVFPYVNYIPICVCAAAKGIFLSQYVLDMVQKSDSFDLRFFMWGSGVVPQQKLKHGSDFVRYWLS